MKISARIDNSFRKHVVTLTTNDRARELPIAPGVEGVLLTEIEADETV